MQRMDCESKAEETLAHRQVLEEPRSQNVCGHLGEDAPLLVVPPLSVGLVLLTCARRGHGPVQAVACGDANQSSVSFFFCFIKIQNVRSNESFRIGPMFSISDMTDASQDLISGRLCTHLCHCSCLLC